MIPVCESCKLYFTENLYFMPNKWCITPHPLDGDCVKQEIERRLSKRILDEQEEHKKQLRKQVDDELYKKEYKQQKAIEKWLFITVRPPAGYDFNEFRRKVNIMIHDLRKKNMVGYLAYEQKGTNEETSGNGYHIHALVEAREERARVIDRIIKPLFKEIIYKIDYRKGKSNYEHTLEYIKGKKAGKDKEGASLWDRRWRESIGLLDLYAI